GCDGWIRVSGGATRDERGGFPGHRAAVTALAYSPYGGRLASASADTTALVWDPYAEAKASRPSARELSTKEWDHFWMDLASPKAATAYRAICLGLTSPRQAVAFLTERLRPAAGPTKAALAQLIAELDSTSFAARQKASLELEKFGELAVPALKQELENRPSLEIQRRLEQVLSRIEEDILTSDDLRNLRALEVLEHAAHPDAVTL